MATVDVTFAGAETLERARALLAGVEGGFDRAVREAQKRAATHLRSASAAAIREQYAISAFNIRAGENVKISYSYGEGLEAHVLFAGRKIPLYRFDGASPVRPAKDTAAGRTPVMVKGAWTMQYPGLPAYGHVRRDTAPQRFDHAFVARMKAGSKGHTGIFERVDGGKIQEIMGLSIPQMLGNREVEEKLADDAAEVFQERLDHNIQAILSGYWG